MSSEGEETLYFLFNFWLHCINLGGFRW